MTDSIVGVIQHYQRSIDNSQDNEDRLLYCIKKLYKMPIKVEHLQETGVGKTVNSLRKFNGEIGVAAKSLVTKWKAMVAAEEEPMDTTPQSNDNEINDSHNNNHDDEDDDAEGQREKHSPHYSDGGKEDDVNHNRHITSEHYKTSSGHGEKVKHKKRHKDRHSSSSSSSKQSEDKHKNSSLSSKSKDGHTHKSSSSSSKDREKEMERKETEHKSREKHKSEDQEKHKERSDKSKEEKSRTDKESKHDSTPHKSSSSGHSSKTKSDEKHISSSSRDKHEKEKHRSEKHKSSSKDKEKSKDEKSSSSKDKHDRKSSSSSSSHKSSTKETSDPSNNRKRRNTSDDNDSNDFKSPEPKVAKVKKSKNAEDQDDDEENCFDSSMGANFGDILGMLNAPTKKSKKSLKSATATGSSTSNSSNLKDSPKASTSSSSSASSKTNGLKTSSSLYSPQSSSKSFPTEKPDLLAPTAKLAPLDPSIALELPTISTNYKPMPLNQTVMDCVFNTSCSSSSKPMRTLTDDEAYQHGISSKTMRTKIYSGAKTGQILQVPTLFDLCIRILQKNIDALEYTGGVPFEVLRPVLERATPQQLFIFEDYNPYLMEDSDVLWQTHVQRSYRTQKRMENESWREMFLRCQEEEERRLSVLKNNIKQSQKVAAAPVRKTQLAFVDSMVKPPRNILRKQEQYGTKSKLVATPAARVASLQSVTPNAAKTGDQRLKVAPNVRDHAQVASSSMRPKKAPLMQKTLAFMRGRLKR